MDIIANIPIENVNQNQTQILVEQFKHFNIEIFGTYEKPLFKAKDIGELLGFKNVREIIKNYNNKQKLGVSLTDTIGRSQETNMLTEKGLYKILMRSRKPIAEEFQDWVCELIEKIRLNSNNLLQTKIKELEYYKEPSYQELPLDESVYCLSTDIENVSKVGKTTTNTKTRKDQLQTACVKDVNILHQVKTSNCTLLEHLIHYSLDKYRLGKREHFNCRLEHIKFVMDKCAKIVNTIGSIRQNITETEFIEKLGTSISTDVIKEKIIHKKIYKNIYTKTDLNQLQNDIDFDLDEFLIDKPNNILIQELN